MATFFPKLAEYINQLAPASIDETRLPQLDKLIAHIKPKVESGESINLNFICTHNSRRSHLSQVWAQVLAAYYGLNAVHCYSGGTANTALFPAVAETLSKQGLQMETLSEGDNPVYAFKYGLDAPPIIGFSKIWDHPFNPQKGFAAIMTCAQADADCPFIPGAEARIPITYEDPKLFDDSPLKMDKYAERSVQISQEMNYVFHSL